MEDGLAPASLATEDSVPLLHPVGMVLIFVGMCAMGYAGLIYEPSVSSGSGLYGVPERINNTGLLQRQLLIFIAGAAFFVSGIVSWAASVLFDLVREATRKIVAEVKAA